MRRARTILAVLAGVVFVVALALWAMAPVLEDRAAAAIARAGAGAGVAIGDVQLAWNGPIRLRQVVVDRADTGRVEVERAEIRWGLAGGREPRAHVRGFDLHGIRMSRGPLTMELNETAFDVVSWEVRDGMEHLRL